jgi:hypothetical protein
MSQSNKKNRAGAKPRASDMPLEPGKSTRSKAQGEGTDGQGVKAPGGAAARRAVGVLLSVVLGPVRGDMHALSAGARCPALNPATRGLLLALQPTCEPQLAACISAVLAEVKS